MRHHPWTALLASLAVLFLPSASAADVCEKGNSFLVQSSTTGTPCTSALTPISKYEKYTVWSTTECNDGAWNSHDNPQGSLEATAPGVCGDNAPYYDPCHGEITGPYNDGGNGSTYQFTLDVSYGFWTGYGCDVGQRGMVSKTTPSEGCTGGFCCSLGVQCAQIDRWWNASTCTCSYPPSTCPGSCPDPEAVGPTDICQYPDTGCPSPQINYGTGCCYNPTPIILDIEGNGFSLTDIEHGVLFPLRSTDEIVFQTAWTRAGSDDAWLVLDRNGNGKVDNGSELFGSSTPQPEPPNGQGRNGFLALAEYDKPANGGNANGWIDAGDSVYSSLRLWQDVNHDGVSQPEELHTLASLGVSAIELDYKPSKRIDEFGNEFRYRAKVTRTRGGEAAGWAFDVLLRVSAR